ncbi:MAG: agmatine deiminase family protein [Ectothiorhodospiraceae bacterium]|nr:agmatine deiminase family protein [Ectothiorhodospiraceae bacterium]
MTRRRLPAEWEPQSALLLTWPHRDGDWGNDLEDVQQTFAAMARAVAPRQRLVVACHDQTTETEVRRRTRGLSSVTYLQIPSNDIWVRDHGPITVLEDGRPRLLDFRFNGWGNKYPSALDDRLTAALAPEAFPGLPLESINVVLEGGSIETDGAGTLLTTTRCLLHPSRNPGVERTKLERWLHDWFGVRRVLWLEHGELEGDDTDGHIDMLARFAPGNRILYTACDDRSDPHHAPLEAMAQELERFRAADGSAYRLLPLPWPPARHDENGERLPLSYANFLVINGAVLVPVYDLPTDEPAMDVIRHAFPHRAVIPVPAHPLVRQHGSVHCASMQIPAAVA